MNKTIPYILASALLITTLLSVNPLLLNIAENFSEPTESQVVDKMSEESRDSTSMSRAKEEAVAPRLDKSYTALKNEIRTYISEQEGFYGIYFISLTTGQTFGINENKVFDAASTVKVPVNLYLYNRIVQNKVNPSKTLIYTEGDYEEGTGSIQNEDFGKKFSIRELSRLSIVESDNVAVNMLMRYLGRNNILKYMETIVHHSIDKKRNAATAKDMALYLKALLEFKENNPEEGAELLDYLKNTEFNDRIPLYLPEDIPVAHKIGTQVQAVHDVGIIFAEKPYILSVMSGQVDEEMAPEVIARISRMVYDYEQK